MRRSASNLRARSAAFSDLERRPGERARTLRDVRLELWPEAAHEPARTPCRRIGKGANRASVHVLRDLVDRVEVAHPRGPALDLHEQFVQPAGALAALRALTARLVAEEARDDQR